MSYATTSAYEPFSEADLTALRSRLHKSLKAHGVHAKMPSLDCEPLADQVYRLAGLVSAAALRDRMRVMNNIGIGMGVLATLDYESYRIVSPLIDISREACMMRMLECSALNRPHANDPDGPNRVIYHLLQAATLIMTSINSGMSEAYPSAPAGEPMVMPAPEVIVGQAREHVQAAVTILSQVDCSDQGQGEI